MACPCKKKECPYHGKCGKCKAHHEQKRTPPYCKRKKKATAKKKENKLQKVKKEKKKKVKKEKK